MAVIAASALGLSPIACYIHASPRGREAGETLVRLFGGLALALLVVTTPYLVAFADEIRGRRQDRP